MLCGWNVVIVLSYHQVPLYNQRYAAAARCQTPGKSGCSFQASTCLTGGMSFCVLHLNKYYCS